MASSSGGSSTNSNKLAHTRLKQINLKIKREQETVKKIKTELVCRGAGVPLIQIKTEPKPVENNIFSTSERLTSFRLPRDLTLGGIRNVARSATGRPNLIQNNKKVYTPNLNAVRNKNVGVKTSRDTTITHSRVRGKGARSDRGVQERSGGIAFRSNSRNAVIATFGLFSEGAGDSTSKRLIRQHRSNTNDDSVARLCQPMDLKKEKANQQLEQKNISEIYDLDADFLDDDSASSSSDGFLPINLLRIKKDVKSENRVNGNECKTENGSDQECRYPTSVRDFFDRTAPQLFLMQLPDTLPGCGPIQEPVESAEFERPASPGDPETSYCTMAQLDEGLIGRLVRYRSGKTKLILGNSQFDIELGIEPGLLQEVVSASAATNISDRSGSMINLGQIAAKLSAIPDWESMLQKMNDAEKLS